MRVTRTIDATTDELEAAKETAVMLTDNVLTQNVLDLFYTSDLAQIESGIKNLNSYASKAWLLSSLILYTTIYDKQMYQQSGLDWKTYSQESRSRLGIDNRDITEQLAAARFFIKNYKSLLANGFTVEGSARKLARAELAVEVSGSLDQTIKHICSDSFNQFKDWYSTFKIKKALPSDIKRTDIDVNTFSIKGKKAITVAEDIEENDKNQLEKYIEQIFQALANGYIPAIIPVYDEKEAKVLSRLRDKNRAKK